MVFTTLYWIRIKSVCVSVCVIGVVEVYRVARRVELGIKATAVCSEKLQELLKDISRVWNNLMGFMSLANLSVSNSTAKLKKHFMLNVMFWQILYFSQVERHSIQFLSCLLVSFFCALNWSEAESWWVLHRERTKNGENGLCSVWGSLLGEYCFSDGR